MTAVYNSNRSGAMADRKASSEISKRVTDVRSGSMPNKIGEALVTTVPTPVVRTKIVTKDGKLRIVEDK